MFKILRIGQKKIRKGNRKEVFDINGTTTSWFVVGAGIIVSAIGYFLMPGQFAAGVLGFGLAHIVLGLLDLTRPAVRNDSGEAKAGENMEEGGGE